MASPFESRVRLQIAEATDVARRDSLRADLARYLARTGEVSAAEALIRELRQSHDRGETPRVTLRIMCAEGVLHYFSALDRIDQAIDRFARVRLLSESLADQEMTAIASAWLSHLYFNKNEYVQSVSCVKRAIDSANTDNHEALCRARLVLADSYQLLGDASRGRAAYNRAREAAVALGDHAMVGAVAYNQAALQVFVERIRLIFGDQTEPVSPLVRVALDTAISYQNMAGLRSLNYLLVIAQVNLLILERQPSQAYQLALDALGKCGDLMTDEQRLSLEVDAAYCAVRVGRESAARSFFQTQPWLALSQGAEPGEAAIDLSSLAEVARRLGEADQARELEQRAGEMHRAYVEQMSTLEDAMRSLGTE